MKHKSMICKLLTITAALTISSLQNATADPLLDPTFNTLFKPLMADPTEPRIAVMPWLDDNYLQLDIGTSVDLYQNDKKDFAVGVDFGTYSLLERGDNFKFPVDTIDYMFGVNATWKKTIASENFPFNELSARVRLSHISAHFEDGHFDKEANQWIQGDCPFDIPFTYSREFINAVVALSSPDKRIYAGYQYIYHTSPENISPHSFQAGVEVGRPDNIYAALDYKLLPIWDESRNESQGYRGTVNLQAGTRLGFIGLDGVRIAYNYFNGMSRHGMYFYRDESYSSLGMIIDL
ncbi:MAG: DUF1207 domain-containing protein [Chlorobiaceae bacterium]|jgi:hypothetical protein|nr:DUF1207 domain-containing protein [Chlorobiaceae bacterium]